MDRLLKRRAGVPKGLMSARSLLIRRRPKCSDGKKVLSADARPVTVVDNSVTVHARPHAVRTTLETLGVRSYHDAGDPFIAGDDISTVFPSALTASRNSEAAGHDPEAVSDASAPVRATPVSVDRRVVARAATRSVPASPLSPRPKSCERAPVTQSPRSAMHSGSPLGRLAVSVGESSRPQTMRLG